MSLTPETPETPEPTVPAEVLAAIRVPFEAFGGAWVDAPVLQPLGLLLDLAGEAMRSRLLVVQGEGAEAAVLRPDFTIPVAQSHIASGQARGRYLYQGKAFQASGPGGGGEFLQIGAELFGPAADVAAEDAAVAALAWTAAGAGGRKDLSLVMGDVGLFDGFVRAIGAPTGVATRLTRAFADGRSVEAELVRAQGEAPAPPAGSGRLAGLLSDLPEAEAAAVLEELWRLAGIQPVGGRSPGEIVHRLIERSAGDRGPRLTAGEAGLIGRYLAISGSPRAALDQVESLAYEAKVEFDLALQPWVRRVKALNAAGLPETALTLSTGFSRPFGYYDGMLFEVRSAALGAGRPVAAGGRYDGLPARLGGAGEPGAVGCIVRPARAWSGAAA
ncbi:MAG TPA: ATP phosphoribosyltransferase regulatory subunit [Caulobacteraceae bacterium]|jgi:ATP phosphoribosyltransferase regulatory subunit|nr:ATP phosphoribosyltransferase regulatory subunit [Caulobacteraceae bacterium]